MLRPFKSSSCNFFIQSYLSSHRFFLYAQKPSNASKIGHASATASAQKQVSNAETYVFNPGQKAQKIALYLPVPLGGPAPTYSATVSPELTSPPRIFTTPQWYHSLNWGVLRLGASGSVMNTA